jgi:hypothetical protein
MSRTLEFIKSHWKRMLVLASLAGLGTFSALRVHERGVEFGKQVGRCEMVCAIYEAEFVALNEGCQCGTPWDFTFTIPLDPDYFE